MKNLANIGLRRKRARQYTALSSVITAAVIALAILFNMAFFALADHFRWYADMTADQVFSLSDATVELLSDVTGDVNIYFAVEADKIADASPYLFYVYQTARLMEARFENIHVDCVDVVVNPGFFKSYYATAAQDIKTTSVIVESGTEFRLFNLEAFFVFDEDTGSRIWAYEGEYKIVSAILSMTSAELPVVHVTTTHGERTGADAQALYDLFSDAGYEVKEIDLAKEEIDPDARIILVNDPVYDFAGIEGGDGNEIAKLDAFLDGFGALFVFTSPEHAGSLTNLSELLSEWGVGFTPDTYVRDTANAISTDGRTLVAQYAPPETLGASMYLDFDNLSAPPKTILPNAMPLRLLYDADDQLDGTKEVSAALSAYDTAEAVYDGETVAKGAFPLLTISRESRIQGNEYYYSYVLVSGSADILRPGYLNSGTYANSDILYNTMRLPGRDRILADIDFKVLDDTSMDITTRQANNWTVALTAALPVVIAVIGIAVHIRRRNG